MHDGGYAVRMALREGGTVTRVVKLNAPPGEDEHTNLAGLLLRVRDALRDSGASSFALWRYEASYRGVKWEIARPALRAEGVVLAAAAEVGVAVREISPASEQKSSPHRSIDALAAARASTLTGSWTKPGSTVGLVGFRPALKFK